jgi:hypothetical protein
MTGTVRSLDSGSETRGRVKSKLGSTLTSARLSSMPRIAVALLGAATLVGGAIAVFVTENGTGSAALIAAGVVLCLVGLMGEGGVIRGPGGWEVEWPRKTEELLDQADAADAAGEDEIATQLRLQAEQLERLGPFAQRYEAARRQPPGPDRTRQLSAILQEAAKAAHVLDLDREGVRNLFATGEDGLRILALTLIQRTPRLADSSVMTQAIDAPRSAFELWHALLAARAAATHGTIAGDDVSQLRESLKRAASSSLFEPHNRELAREVLQILEHQTPA